MCADPTLFLMHIIHQRRVNYVSRVNFGSSGIFSDSHPIPPASQTKNISFLRHTFVENVARMV